MCAVVAATTAGSAEETAIPAARSHGLSKPLRTYCLHCKLYTRMHIIIVFYFMPYFSEGMAKELLSSKSNKREEPTSRLIPSQMCAAACTAVVASGAGQACVATWLVTVTAAYKGGK